jgi:hypothetical protein
MVNPYPLAQQVYVNPCAPNVDLRSSWGTFGSYDNWAREFYRVHGRSPNDQDVRDFWWSQQYAAWHGGQSPYPPTDCGCR